MRLADKNVDFVDLLKPEYIGSWKGSSLAELAKAAEDHGMYAVPGRNMTGTVLRNSSYPIILHVKADENSKRYDHYELFLGSREGRTVRAVLFDPPKQIKLVPFFELAHRWDGTGLVVSHTEIDIWRLFAPARKRFAIYATIALAIILTVHWARRRWLSAEAMMSRPKLLQLSVAQCAGLAVVSSLAGVIYHFANDEGFWAHADATAPIAQAHLGNFIPKLSKNKVARLIDTDTVFIDARFPSDFKSGHLEGAVSVPVNASDEERREAMAGVRKDKQIVCYCQSAGCKFAEEVAIRLKLDGYSNVSVFKGGWQEWKATTGK
jgi:rhodanese-related sulfurtransferase